MSRPSGASDDASAARTRPKHPAQADVGARASGGLMIVAGIAAIGWCVRYLADALSAGQVVGRWGVHPAGSIVYLLSVGGGVVGVMLAVACIALGWRWYRQGYRHPSDT